MQPVLICILLAGLVAVQSTFTADGNADESYIDELEDASHDVAKRTAAYTTYTYQYNLRKCPKPGVPRGGFAWYQSNNVGSIAVYSCKPGFVLKGARIRTCQSNGKWSRSIPVCTDTVKCEDPGKPENSIRFLSSTNVNSIVKYKCKEGYRLAGSSYRVCQASGKWSGIVPKCLGTSCNALSNPSNGNVNVPSRKVGSTAVYTCNTGYNLVGDGSRVCKAGGSWSGSIPTCRAVDCGRLSNPQNGRVTFTKTVFSSTAVYSCNNGFILVGSKQRQCEGDGAWSRNAPVCRTITCGRLDSPTNGKVIVTGTTPGSVATYSCNSGFELIGNERRRSCQNNGQWEGNAPVCRAVVCETLANIANGFITFTSSSVQRPGDKATYSCRDGYILSDGDRIRVCQQDTTYTGEAPSCVAITCGPLRDPPNGNVRVTNTNVGSRALYTCNRGFILRGDNSRTCLSSGSFGGREPSCRPVDCGRLSAPDNGRVFITTTRLAGAAKYSCNDGFELQGVHIRRCGPAGDWTNSAPSCRSVGCGQLSDPQNGRVRLSGTNIGSLASYACSNGFNLIGDRRRVCQQTSQWSGDAPTCQPISCGVLQSPQSGTVTVTGSTPGAVARYTCNRGFELIGESERTCQNDGSYNGQAPICQLILCEQLNNPDNGQVVVSGGNTPGSIARYTCNQGFRRDGVETRICNNDGTYSGVAPTCRETSCRRLTNPLNGQVQFSSSSIGSVATYTCNNGYNFVGSIHQRICRPDGEWSGEEPRCAIVDCGILPEPLFGTVDFTSTTFQSKSTYLCNDGFMLSEQVTRVCQANGRWSGSAPFCQPIACERLTSPENGFVVVRGNSIGAIATYSCNPGFKLIGISATRECQNDGSYSGQAPICEAIRCDILVNPDNGFVKFSGVTVGATGSYSCNKGYTLRGNTVRVCLPNGEWSGEAPTCSGIDCGNLVAPDKGVVNVGTTSFGSIAHYQCNSGYVLIGENSRTCQITGRWSDSAPVCQAVSCSPLDAPDNGFVRFSSNVRGSIASYTCNPGYQLQGVQTRVCQHGGEWSDEAPVCLAISCGVLISPEYGSILISGTSTNAIASYACDKGFNINGQATRVCTSSGVWSGQAPTCQPQDCGNLANPQDGDIDIGGTSFWDTVTYRCNSGYQLIGEAVRTCQESGLWSGTAPYCSPVDCGFLETPDNSRVTITGTIVNSIATYSCFPGYELVGDETRTCVANGQWAGQAPFCKATECGPLVDPINGRVTFNGIVVYSIGTYECDSGFGIKGAVSRMCRKDGTWSGSNPSCEPSDCGPLQSPFNGMVDTTGTRFSDTAHYRCIPGYYIVGETTRTCDKSGIWTGVAPICQPVDCGNLNSPSNGRVEFSSTIFRESAIYSCNFGFQLIGERSRMCQDNGAWSGDTPICERIMCDSLLVPGNGRLELTNGNLVGSVANYFCFPGYSLDGDNERSCQSNMQWTGTSPFCRGNNCRRLSDPIYGQVAVPSFNVGSFATYSCDPGHVLIGQTTRECLQQGVWSGNEPICERIECDVLFPIVNGDVSLEGTKVNDKANYFCDNGFRLVNGDRIRTCLPSGQWSGQEPSCSAVIVQCLPLDNPINGFVNFDTSVGSTAIYSCNNNYVLSDTTLRQCQSNGQWSGFAPICRAIDCGPLTSPTNGNVRVPGTLFGSSARYSCSFGFILEGDAFRVCTIDGTWSGEAPVCRESLCTDLTAPENGGVSVSGRIIGSVATYECNEGYSLNGINTRICRDDQQWSGIAPTCRAINCGQLFAPNNGIVDFSSVSFGSTAHYTCNPGYDLVGDAVRTCQRNGLWSLQEPRCLRIIIECPRLIDPANGDVAMSGNNPGSSATYTCRAGYALTGDDIRFCQTDGAWSGNDPFCRSIDCPQLNDPVNGNIRYIGQGFGAIVRYRCDQGYRLVGDASRTCKSDGFWSGLEPVCIGDVIVPVDCGDPGTPTNGIKIGDNYGYEAIVYYECNNGYTLSGDSTRTCQFNGLWTGVLPTCRNSQNQCSGSGRVFDQCGRACRCQDGKMVECCRLRRDYTSFSDAEKDRYIDAIITLSTSSLYKTRYETLLESYKASFDTDIYNSDSTKSQFFVWNRYFLLEYEDLLLEIDCHIILPFYDWTVLPLNPYISTVWDDKNGFGKSSSDIDYCVNSGPFKYPDYSLISSAGGTCLKREYKNQKFPSRSIIERDILTQPASEFGKFHSHLQLYIHTTVRCFIGGTMCSKDAANDPVFILHLTMLDSIYDRWQRFSKDHLEARYAYDSSQLLLAPGHTVNEYYNNMDLPDNVAICYGEPTIKSHVPIGHNFLAQSFSEVAKKKDLTMGCISHDHLMDTGILSNEEMAFIESKCKNKK